MSVPSVTINLSITSNSNTSLDKHAATKKVVLRFLDESHREKMIFSLTTPPRSFTEGRVSFLFNELLKGDGATVHCSTQDFRRGRFNIGVQDNDSSGVRYSTCVGIPTCSHLKSADISVSDYGSCICADFQFKYDERAIRRDESAKKKEDKRRLHEWQKFSGDEQHHRCTVQ